MLWLIQWSIATLYCTLNNYVLESAEKYLCQCEPHLCDDSHQKQLQQHTQQGGSENSEKNKDSCVYCFSFWTELLIAACMRRLQLMRLMLKNTTELNLFQLLAWASKGQKSLWVVFSYLAAGEALWDTREFWLGLLESLENSYMSDFSVLWLDVVLS